MDLLEKNYRQAVKQLSMMLNTNDNIDMQSKRLWCLRFIDEYQQVISTDNYQIAQRETQTELKHCIGACQGAPKR